MSGGYGPGGYPGQDYGAPDYDDDPERGRPRRQAGGQPPDGPVWGNEQGYSAQDGPGYDDRGDRGYADRGYADPSRYDDGRGYRDRGYGPAGYGQPEGRTGPGYPPPGPPGPPPGGGYRYPPSGPQPGQPPGQWYDERDEEGTDGSFLPGFGRRDDTGDRPRDPGRGRGRAPRRGDRYDDDYRDEYDGRPGQRGGRPDGYGPAGPAGPGPGPGPRTWPAAPRSGYDRDDDWGNTDRRPRRKATRWFPRILVLTVVAVIVVGGLVGGLTVYHKYEARYHPADYAGAGTGEVTVQVMNGDTAYSLAPRLVQLGVIASTRAFTNAAEAAATTTASGSSGLEAGYYELHHHMQASLAYAALLNPANRVQTLVTIPEGKRAVDVITILSQQTKIPLKDFQQVIDHPAQLGLPSYADGKVEGYLFPATYAIVPHETALQILQAMVQRFDVEAQQVNIVAAAKAVGLTPAQLITEASLAQAEGGSVSDYPKIAEVIHNRLAAGMHLQFDSTVLYGLGKYAVSATYAQINTPGPYNTYLNAGLPPGPISNPGDAAIEGILHPDHGNWLYFLTVPGGKSQFSATPLTGQ